MNASLFKQLLLQSIPLEKPKAKRIDTLVRLEQPIAPDFSLLVDFYFDTARSAFFATARYGLHCRPLEVLVQAVRLTSTLDEADNLASLELPYENDVQSKLGRMDLSQASQWETWAQEQGELVKSKALPFAQANSHWEALYPFYNRPGDFHLENVPFVGNYQHRMLAGLALSVWVDDGTFDATHRAWQNVVEADFDQVFLERVRYMKDQYPLAQWKSDYNGIFKEMSERYGNPYLKAPKQKNSLLDEVEIRAEGNRICLIFNNIPPTNSNNDAFWGNLASILSTELGTKVEREDREVFVVEGHSETLLEAVKAWLRKAT